VRSDWEVVVVGAGAAGLTTGRRLARAGVDVLVVEARDRVGGRAWTVASRPGLALDMGCGWLHSGDRNPWTRIAGRLGCNVDQTPTGWGHVADGPEQDDWDRAAIAFYERLDRLGQNEPDRPAADALEPGSRWTPLLEAISSFISGAYLREVSAHDLGRYADTGVNWRVAEGYGALVARYGRDVPVTLSTRVDAVDHGGPRVRVETDRGTLTCAAVVVTVPTPALADGELRFRPALPDKAAAATSCPWAWPTSCSWSSTTAPARNGRLTADSSARSTERRRAPTGCTRSASLRSSATSAPDSRGTWRLRVRRPPPRSPWTRWRKIFGAGIRGRLRPLTWTAWGRDPFARGSYSYAMPGRADARATLAAPVDERLFFAGEASSREAYSTAHGAYLTGRRAAGEVLRALRRRRQPAAEAHTSSSA
jgi:monoamine oxidase